MHLTLHFVPPVAILCLVFCATTLPLYYLLRHDLQACICTNPRG